MVLFRVNVSHHSATATSTTSSNKELRVKLPLTFSSIKYKIKLPKPSHGLVFTKVGEYNTILVDIPLSLESTKTLEGLRRQVMESHSTNNIGSSASTNDSATITATTLTHPIHFSSILNIKGSEKVYHAEEDDDDEENDRRQEDNIIDDFKLLYRELIHWLSSSPKTNATAAATGTKSWTNISSTKKLNVGDEYHNKVGIGIGGGGGGTVNDRERLKDIWNDLIEALQWVALIHVLFYSFLFGLILGVLFVTDSNE